jgi:hypothetical protein
VPQRHDDGKHSNGEQGGRSVGNRVDGIVSCWHRRLETPCSHGVPCWHWEVTLEYEPFDGLFFCSYNIGMVVRQLVRGATQTLTAGFGAMVVATRARVPTVAGLCGSHDPRAVPRARALATLSSDARPGGSRNKNKGTAVCGSMFCVHSDETLRIRVRVRVRVRRARV